MIRIRFTGESADLAQSQPDGSGSPKSASIVSRNCQKVKPGVRRILSFLYN